MHNPLDPTTGRGMLLFAAVTVGLGVFLAVGRRWAEAGMWAGVGVFLGCFGTMIVTKTTRWDRLLLIVGSVAAVVVVGLVIWINGLDF